MARCAHMHSKLIWPLLSTFSLWENENLSQCGGKFMDAIDCCVQPNWPNQCFKDFMTLIAINMLFWCTSTIQANHPEIRISSSLGFFNFKFSHTHTNTKNTHTHTSTCVHKPVSQEITKSADVAITKTISAWVPSLFAMCFIANNSKKIAHLLKITKVLQCNWFLKRMQWWGQH